MIRLTSGLIPVPFGFEQTVTTVSVVVAGTLSDEAIVPFQVNTLHTDNTKVQARIGVLAVPPAGSARLLLDDVAGQIIEINLGLPRRDLVPSITIVQTDSETKTADTKQWLSPVGFTRLPGDTDRTSARRSNRPGTVTSGIIPVPISANEFSPAFSYRLMLLCSNFSADMVSLAYDLQWARPLFHGKLPLQQGTVGLEPGTGAVVAFDQTEGKAVELNITVPRPSVVCNIAVLRLFPDGEASDLTLLLPGALLTPVPTKSKADGG